MFKAVGFGGALVLLAYMANSEWVANNEASFPPCFKILCSHRSQGPSPQSGATNLRCRGSCLSPPLIAIPLIPIMCAWPVSSPLPVCLRNIQSPALIFAFLIGYGGIIMEEELSFNKSGVALLMAVFLWTIRSLTGDHAAVGPLLMQMPCLASSNLCGTLKHDASPEPDITPHCTVRWMPRSRTPCQISARSSSS